MPGSKVERLQSSSGGLNTDALPDYLAADESPLITNFLTGFKGRLPLRGPIRNGIQVNTNASAPAQCLWTLDDKVLVRFLHAGTPQYWVVDTLDMSASDHTADFTRPPVNNIFAQYGSTTYGARDDLSGGWTLGQWTGFNNLIDQTAAPTQFVDLKAHTYRLFVLGGKVPGSGADPASPRVLYYSDTPNTSGAYANLSLLASWQDNVSNLTNQILYDGDDEPVGLATCGRWLAILGTQSVNLLTGDGTTNYAVRNISREFGCVDRGSIVETSSGFFFLSSRGYCFCDGSSVVSLSKNKNLLSLIEDGQLPPLAWHAPRSAALLEHGYVAINRPSAGGLWLLHMDTGTWGYVTSGLWGSVAPQVFRTHRYPLAWDGNLIWRLDELTVPAVTTANLSVDHNVVTASNLAIPAEWRTRTTRLATPLAMANLSRILLDYQWNVESSGPAPSASALKLEVRNADTGDLLDTLTLPVQTGSFNVTRPRQRAQFENSANVGSVQLRVIWDDANASSVSTASVFDAWIEFRPGQDRPTI